MTTSTPVQYKSVLNLAELSYVKVSQDFDDGTTKTAKLPVFDGIRGGLEALFYVISRFERTAIDELYMSTDPANTIPDYPLHFIKFKQVLDQQALHFWTNHVLQRYPNTGSHTAANWTNAKNMLKKSFAGGDQARDYIIDYLATDSCRKPVRTSIEDHVRRIIQLIDYANDSQGNGPLIQSTYQYNKIIMNTFPKTWQRNWDNSGQSLAQATVDDIILYFSRQKIAADQDFSAQQGRGKRKGFGRSRNNKATFNDPNVRTSSDKRQKTGGQKYYPNDSPCPIHLHGTHSWGDCRDNKKSPNFVPLSSNRRPAFQNQNQNQSTYQSAGRGRGSGTSNTSTWQNRNQANQRPRGTFTRDQHYQDCQSHSTNTQSTLTPPSEIHGEQHAYDSIGPQEQDGSDVGGLSGTNINSNWPPTRPDQPREWSSNGAFH